MYRIFADETLIYDSTLEDYKIGKGNITKEADKSGSFVFSLYPDHFYYDRFVKLKTVVKVEKSGRIAFRGRVLNDVGDYWNTGTFTCEGELGFLRDSVIRPFDFTGTPEALFTRFIEEHNAQVDEFKRFKIGTVTVVDPNNYINRSSAEYPTTLDILTSALIGSTLGGHFYITHGDDGTDPIPTIHYVADYPNTATQPIEFGVNLKNFTRTAKADELATAIIPLGTQTESTGQRLTIADVNDGLDYVYSEAGVALYGWVFKTVVWEDVTLADNLKRKAQEYVEGAVNQAITVELNAIDLHLLDRSIESFEVCDYIPVRSTPHKFSATLLCNKQTMDLLKPENDTVTLGYHITSFTGASTQMVASVSTLGKQVSSIKQDAQMIRLEVYETLEDSAETLRSEFEQTATGIRAEVSADLLQMQKVIDACDEDIVDLSKQYTSLNSRVTQNANSISSIVTGVGANGTVTAASIVAAINNAGSSVKLSADHVDISGFVTVSDLKGTGKVEIDAGNIAAGGTINGCRLSTTRGAKTNIVIDEDYIEFGDYVDMAIGQDGQFGIFNTRGDLELGSSGSFRIYDDYGCYWQFYPWGLAYVDVATGRQIRYLSALNT